MADQQRQYVQPLRPVSDTLPTNYWDGKDEQPVTKLRQKPQEPHATLWKTCRFWTFLAFVVTGLVLSILILNILFKKDNKKAGIVTLSVRAIYITLELNC